PLPCRQPGLLAASRWWRGGRLPARHATAARPRSLGELGTVASPFRSGLARAGTRCAAGIVGPGTTSRRARPGRGAGAGTLRRRRAGGGHAAEAIRREGRAPAAGLLDRASGQAARGRIETPRDRNRGAVAQGAGRGRLIATGIARITGAQRHTAMHARNSRAMSSKREWRAATPEDGGARRDRTADLLHAMQALSQLSYGPTSIGHQASAYGWNCGVPTGLRRPVAAVKGECPRPLDDGDNIVAAPG